MDLNKGMIFGFDYRKAVCYISSSFKDIGNGNVRFE